MTTIAPTMPAPAAAPSRPDGAASDGRFGAEYEQVAARVERRHADHADRDDPTVEDASDAREVDGSEPGAPATTAREDSTDTDTDSDDHELTTTSQVPADHSAPVQPIPAAPTAPVPTATDAPTKGSELGEPRAASPVAATVSAPIADPEAAIITGAPDADPDAGEAAPPISSAAGAGDAAVTLAELSDVSAIEGPQVTATSGVGAETPTEAETTSTDAGPSDPATTEPATTDVATTDAEPAAASRPAEAPGRIDAAAPNETVAPRRTEAISATSPTALTDPNDGVPTSRTEAWEQVATVVRPLRLAADGSHRLALQLTPDELGTVHLEVALRDGRLSVHAVAETSAARDALAGSLPQLRATLTSSGIDLGNLDVSDGSAGSDVDGRSAEGRRDRDGTGVGGGSTRRLGPIGPATPVHSTHRPHAAAGPGAVDLAL